MSHLRSQITQSHLPRLNYTQRRDPLAVEVTSSQGLGTWGWGHCGGREGTAPLALEAGSQSSWVALETPGQGLQAPHAGLAGRRRGQYLRVREKRRGSNKKEQSWVDGDWRRDSGEEQSAAQPGIHSRARSSAQRRAGKGYLWICRAYSSPEDTEQAALKKKKSLYPTAERFTPQWSSKVLGSLLFCWIAARLSTCRKLV